MDPLVVIEGLSKRYGDFTAVDGLDLTVPPGEIFALLGPNGAGKTTTIRMLMGILEPTAGSARIDGRDCFQDRAEVKRSVGYLPDEPVFYDYLRASELIRFVGEMHGLRPREIDAAALPLVERPGLREDLDEFATNFSKGMKKKLATVCALLHNPRLLILDEPTNGLDPFATRTMHEFIREMAAEGKSIFFSTHLLDQAEKLCHRVGIVHKGKLAAIGRLDELRNSLTAGGSLEDVFFAVTAPEEQVPPPERQRKAD